MTAKKTDDQKADGQKAGGYDLLITRTFAAPVALVFRLWERPEHMIRWWGPKDFTCTALDLDFRPGGAWRACIVSDAYGESWMSGEFREIEKNRRIVFTFSWEDGRDGEGVDTVVSVAFEEKDGGTVQHFHQTPFHSVEGRDSHIGGWSECLDKQLTYTELLAKEEVK